MFIAKGEFPVSDISVFKITKSYILCLIVHYFSRLLKMCVRLCMRACLRTCETCCIRCRNCNIYNHYAAVFICWIALHFKEFLSAVIRKNKIKIKLELGAKMYKLFILPSK